VLWGTTDDVLSDANVLRHEAGHFAGLFHTTEWTPGEEDPLSDTPSCADVNGLEACPDFSNVMFPFGATTPGELTAQQARVVQGSALYRGVYAPGEEPMTPYPAAATTKSFTGEAPRFRTLEVPQPTRRLDPAARAWAEDLTPRQYSIAAGLVCGELGLTKSAELVEALDDEVVARILNDPRAPRHVKSRLAGRQRR
jgi:hypothetical protein